MNKGTWLLAIALTMAGCARPQSPSAPAIMADSLVLERTPCFGACPTYRLRLSRDGSVLFRSMNRGDSSRVITDRIPVEAFTELLKQAEKSRFYDLPERIMGNARLCPMMATDHPGVNISIYAPRRSRTVYDYLGCRVRGDSLAQPLVPLRAFEMAIDSVAGTARWTRPNRN